jgi:hypothetical protein
MSRTLLKRSSNRRSRVNSRQHLRHRHVRVYRTDPPLEQTTMVVRRPAARLVPVSHGLGEFRAQRRLLAATPV